MATINPRIFVFAAFASGSPSSSLRRYRISLIIARSLPRAVVIKRLKSGIIESQSYGIRGVLDIFIFLLNFLQIGSYFKTVSCQGVIIHWSLERNGEGIVAWWR